jgi:hypothetical protein
VTINPAISSANKAFDSFILIRLFPFDAHAIRRPHRQTVTMRP